MLEVLDKDQKYFQGLLTRNYVEQNNNKDLRKIGRSMKGTFLIDNASYAVEANPYNNIYIKSWFGNESDEELARLIPIIEEMAKVRDVSKYIKEKKLHHTILK